ncbi:unnamed protein product [Oikopleura dioica]|uniref:Uncharacterized protein n=1 Tax=Oikopleura dioica TaxID=34765 RepID=E4YIC3_OIKDI|nr:unnamed protein product [Oikopleura dioica]
MSHLWQLSDGVKLERNGVERSDRSNSAPLHQNFGISLHRSATFNLLRGVKRSDD